MELITNRDFLLIHLIIEDCELIDEVVEYASLICDYIIEFDLDIDFKMHLLINLQIMSNAKIKELCKKR